MKYDANRMAARLKETHKTSGYSIDVIAKKCGVSRQTVVNWEKGISFPNASHLFELCSLYNCDIGYLFCEYELKTRVKTDIQDETGLSDQAINAILTNNEKNVFYAKLALEKLLAESGTQLLYQIGYYLALGHEFDVELLDGHTVKQSAVKLVEIQERLSKMREDTLQQLEEDRNKPISEDLRQKLQDSYIDLGKDN